MQMNLLLSHDFGKFYKNLPMASNYYSSLPRVFQEALIIMSTNKFQVDKSYHIEEPTMKTYFTFWNIYQANYNDNKTALRLLHSYKNTLYYYILFDSPKVTKMTLNDEEWDNYD